MENIYIQSLSGEIDLGEAKKLIENSPDYFLTHCYDNWFMDLRESIETKYSSLCKAIANQFRSLGQYEEAERYERKLLKEQF